MVAFLAVAGFAFAGEIDDTFNKVNRHLYGIGEAMQEASPVQQDEEPPPPPQPKPKAKRQAAPPAYEQAPASDSGFTAAAGGDDDHFIQSDDYFVQKHDLEGHAWIWVDLAKAVTAPSSGSKGEGEFMKVRDGQNYWTKYYWQTRIANKSELKLGMHVIAFNDNRRNDIYQAPEKKDRARGGGWFYAKITDMSDLYKGYVTVSGNYKVSPGNLRVIKR